MKILLATDGSSNAIEAAKFLCRLGIGQPVELTLLSVCFDPQSAEAEVIQPWFPEWLDKQRAAFEAHHQELETMLADRCASITKTLHDGHAARRILTEAETTQSDLIVMGAQGHSAVGRVLLGSVSDSVATHAPCSVLVVHPDAEGGCDESLGPPSAALAYDSSPAAKAALAELTGLDLPQETPLTLISVAPIFDYLVGEGLAAVAVENEKAICESMRRTVNEACDQIRPSFANVQGTVEKGRHIGDALVETVKRQNNDLLMIGDSGHSLLHDWILGSTTKYVLRHSPCSVWLSRHHRRSEDSESATS